MNDNEYDLFKKIATLEAENENLTNQVNALREDSTKQQVYDIYEQARHKLYTWIGGILVVFTLFGLVSINQIIAKIETKILEEGEEKVVDKLSEEYLAKHTSRLTDAIASSLKPTIDQKMDTIFTDIQENTYTLVKAEVERNVREELTKTFDNVENITTSETASFAKAIEKTYEDRKYWVIAASSVLRSDVENELDRVKRKVGPTFDQEFPNAEVTYPYPGTNYYPLVLGAGLPYKEANELRIKAIKFGFRADTFLWQAK